MSETTETVGGKSATGYVRQPLLIQGVPPALLRALAVLAVGYAWPLIGLVRVALASDLYSHIILIPFISYYLIRQKRIDFSAAGVPNRGLAGILTGLGILLVLPVIIKFAAGVPLGREDSLALSTLSFVLIFGGLCAYHLGAAIMRGLAFPLGFMVFMVPFPSFLLSSIETFLQHGSAAVAGVMFSFSDTPVLQQDLIFQLPGIRIQVAPECSGIHSSLVLLITSVLAGHFFLRSVATQAVLAFAVIPLALLRNGFRVFVLGELCARISPEMIDSPIHHHGGPIFFALSLIPFFLLLFALVKYERRRFGPLPPG